MLGLWNAQPLHCQPASQPIIWPFLASQRRSQLRRCYVQVIPDTAGGLNDFVDICCWYKEDNIWIESKKYFLGKNLQKAILVKSYHLTISKLLIWQAAHCSDGIYFWKLLPLTLISVWIGLQKILMLCIKTEFNITNISTYPKKN